MMSGFSGGSRLGKSLLIVLVAVVLIALAIGVAVQADECDGSRKKPCGENVYYSEEITGEIKIGGIGVIYDSFFTGSNCTKVTITGMVTIGKNEFKGCTSLLSVSALNSVVIKESAFEGCSSLESVTLTNTESVGDFAFAGCTSLSSITIPASVTSIGVRAFDGIQFYAPPSFEPLSQDAESLKGYEYRGGNGSLYRYGEAPASLPPAEKIDRTPVIAAAAVLAVMAAAMTASFMLKRKP